MELRFPWMIAVGIVGAALVVAAVLGWRRSRTGTRVPVANTRSLTALPSYRRAMTRHRVRLAVAAGAALVTVGASVVAAARPFSTSTDRPEIRNRDIMLCLDISGSMAQFDADLVETFAQLVKRFQGERIGMVIFNGSAATVFPLTDDYDFINDELETAHRALEGDPRLDAFFSGTYNSLGTSLIGDGVASCISGFDRTDDKRPRSLVLATDNHLAGYPLIDLTRAGELAKARSVRIYSLNPKDDTYDAEARELEQVSKDSGGAYYAMSDGRAVGQIVASVQAQEAVLIKQAERTLRTDQPTIPVAAAGVGLIALVLLRRRQAR